MLSRPRHVVPALRAELPPRERSHERRPDDHVEERGGIVLLVTIQNREWRIGMLVKIGLPPSSKTIITGIQINYIRVRGCVSRNAPIFRVRGESEVVLPHDVVGKDAGGGTEVEGGQQHEGVVLSSGSR